MSEKVKIHNHGHVMLEEHMGSDLAIVNNARVSFNSESDELGENEVGLINYLMRNRHGTPFEAVVFKFDIKAPLFVIREWQRHRIGSFNEQSARYSEIPDEFYVPKRQYIRTQVGKPGAYSFEQVDANKAAYAQHIIEFAQERAFDSYHNLLDAGIAKELARTVLPVGMYSRMKWVCNLRSLMNFISLRNSEHAQREIREYSQAVENLVSNIVPIAMEAFNKNGRICP